MRDFRDDGFACFGCIVYLGVVLILAITILASLNVASAVVQAEYSIQSVGWDNAGRSR